MREAAATMRHEFIGLYGMLERNWYLIKRYAWWEVAFFFWTAANTLTIVFIAKGVVAEGGTVNLDRLTTILLCTHDMAEAEILAERVGILDDGRLLALEPADQLKARYGAETLEEAFFAATGKSFEEEGGDEENEK